MSHQFKIIDYNFLSDDGHSKYFLLNDDQTLMVYPAYLFVKFHTYFFLLKKTPIEINYPQIDFSN